MTAVAPSQQSAAAAPDAATPARPATERRAAYAFANLVPKSLDERSIATEIWLEDICKAAWASKETMRIGAMVAAHVREGTTTPLILKDIEGVLSIPKEEVNRNFRMLKMFGLVERYDIEGPGNIALSLRLSAMQRLRVVDTYRRLEALTAPAAEQRTPPISPFAPAKDAGASVVSTADDATGAAQSTSLAERMQSLQQKLQASAQSG